MKTKCEAIEKREGERRAMEERKHSEEIAFLKKTNVQLKVFNVTIFYETDAIRRNSQSSKEIGSCLKNIMCYTSFSLKSHKLTP